VKLNVPATVGVPSIFPSAWKVNPAGSVPAVADHVYGGVPPDAAIAAAYASDMPALGSTGAVVMVGPALIAIVKGFCDCAPAESRTCTVIEYDPACVGFPLISPVFAFSDSPGGNWPEITDSV
jgi:hypothetical protein